MVHLHGSWVCMRHPHGLLWAVMGLHLCGFVVVVVGLPDRELSVCVIVSPRQHVG
jgi:hypothetical protein